MVNLFSKKVGKVNSARCPSIPADAPAPNLDASSRIKDLISQHVNVPATVDLSCRLDDLGVDSLLAIEVANDLRRVYNASVDARNVAPETILGELASLIGPHCSKASIRSSRSLFGKKSSQYDTSDGDETLEIPHQSALRQIDHVFHHFAVEARCVDFWKTVHPPQLQLPRAYILKALKLV
ncbi:hypothetical protein PDE_04446 [Penicillium oxalicum 114-2]|uniref:Carrier domain-containing protein n=1 Tax=Penicillium oxalicum (strain 114-2 / CGMCC 5302) TaxID=933388 RepID=S7ZLD5_PENO1|nr:hypothetical protein PDE_04446 [Penicillium oxalicum 114-2]